MHKKAIKTTKPNKNIPTTRLDSTSSEEEGYGEITTEDLRQSEKTQVAPVEAEGFGEIQEESTTLEREGSVLQDKKKAKGWFRTKRILLAIVNLAR